MPELPEVESIRRTLAPHLVGRVIDRAVLNRNDFVTGDRSPRALLQGATVQRLERRGKQLAVIAGDGRTVVVQLGMSGQVLIAPATAELPTHVHALWKVRQTGNRILFRDPRRFGGLTTLPSVAALLKRWSALGPDALEITGSQLGAALRSSTRTIKAALLDQSVAAGVGNIYADEALFIAGIHPQTVCRSLTTERTRRLANALRKVLAEAVEARGSTLRDYRDAEGQAGSYAASHRVYGRAGLPCTRCGATLRKAAVAQRTTVFCPVCQLR